MVTQHPQVYAGSVIRVTFSFVDPDTGEGAVLAEPVTARYRHESDTASTEFDVEEVEPGTFTGVFPVPLAGRYAAKCVSSGIEPAVAYDEVAILPSPI